MSKFRKPSTALSPGGGPAELDGYYMPVTQDKKQHIDRKVLVKAGDTYPDRPKFIGGKKVIYWLMVS